MHYKSITKKQRFEFKVNSKVIRETLNHIFVVPFIAYSEQVILQVYS